MTYVVLARPPEPAKNQNPKQSYKTTGVNMFWSSVLGEINISIYLPTDHPATHQPTHPFLPPSRQPASQPGTHASIRPSIHLYF